MHDLNLAALMDRPTHFLHGSANRACALFCAVLVFLIPMLLAANTQAIADGKAPAQQTQVAEEEEHKTCMPVRPLLKEHDGIACNTMQPLPYSEGAFVAYHGEVAVQPPEGI